MGRFLKSFSKVGLVLLIIGGILIYLTAGWFITSIKPGISIDDMWEEELKEGMHVKGEVPLSFECFSYEETWKENSNGSRTAAKTSAYYYTIPIGDVFVALEVPTKDYDAMETLVNETIDYIFYQGAEPTSTVTVDGRLTEMESDMESLFTDYLVEIGYTDADIAAMGTLYVIEQPASFTTMQVMFGIGVFLILIALIIFIIRFRAFKPVKQTNEFQNYTYESIDPTVQNNDTNNLQ